MATKKKPLGLDSASTASPAEAGVVFRKNHHGYDILVDRNSRHEKIGAIFERTAEVTLKPQASISPSERVAVERKAEVLRSLLSAQGNVDVHAALGIMSKIEQALAAPTDALGRQNLIDLQYASRSLYSKLKKRLALEN